MSRKTPLHDPLVRMESENERAARKTATIRFALSEIRRFADVIAAQMDPRRERDQHAEQGLDALDKGTECLDAIFGDHRDAPT